jgi:hypothetical protein
VRYLIVDDEGRIFAVLGSLEQVARELARLGQDSSETSGPFRVVRYDEYGEGLVTTSSFVTAWPLPDLPVPGSRARNYPGRDE